MLANKYGIQLDILDNYIQNEIEAVHMIQNRSFGTSTEEWEIHSMVLAEKTDLIRRMKSYRNRLWLKYCVMDILKL